MRKNVNVNLPPQPIPEETNKKVFGKPCIFMVSAGASINSNSNAKKSTRHMDGLRLSQLRATTPQHGRIQIAPAWPEHTLSMPPRWHHAASTSPNVTFNIASSWSQLQKHSLSLPFLVSPAKSLVGEALLLPWRKGSRPQPPTS